MGAEAMMMTWETGTLSGSDWHHSHWNDRWNDDCPYITSVFSVDSARITT